MARDKRDRFDEQTPPRPARLVEALRHLGHNMNSVIADLCDNSIDGQAKEIRIHIEGKKGDDSPLDKIKRVVVVDDGLGMDGDALHEAFCLGGGKEHEPADLGRFGMGMIISALGVARDISLLTRCKRGRLLKGVLSYDHIQKSDDFVSCLREATDEEILEFENYRPAKSRTGTVVIITNFDGLSHLVAGSKRNAKRNPKTVKALVSHVKLYLAEVFQHFIEANTRIFVNDSEVEPADPMYLALLMDTASHRRPISLKRDMTQLDPTRPYILLDKEFRFAQPDETLLAPVRIKVVACPINPPSGYPKLEKIKAGFDIFRNHRRIAAHQRIALPPSPHHEHSMLRGAIFFPGGTPDNPGYDGAFTVQVNKNGVVLEGWLEDQIIEAVEAAVDYAIRYRKVLQKNLKPGSAGTGSSLAGLTAGKPSRKNKVAANLRNTGGVVKGGLTTTVRKHARHFPGIVAAGKASAVAVKEELSEIPVGVKCQNARTLKPREVCIITRDMAGLLTVRINPDNEYSEWMRELWERVNKSL